jgi:hypothetical protein
MLPLQTPSRLTPGRESNSPWSRPTAGKRHSLPEGEKGWPRVRCRLRDKWAAYTAGEVPWAKFTARDMELALAAEKHWRERFWNKHGQWLEATGLDRPLDEFLRADRLEQEVEELRRRLAMMEEYSPGRELIGAIIRTRWFKRHVAAIDKGNNPDG